MRSRDTILVNDTRHQRHALQVQTDLVVIVVAAWQPRLKLQADNHLKGESTSRREVWVNHSKGNEGQHSK